MIISELKPMVYGGNSETLYYEVFDDGYGILIKNIRGSHPCGYIRLPNELAEKIHSYDDLYVDAEVHGGFTYFDRMEEFDWRWFIGWDYAHLEDYTCAYESYRGPREYEQTHTTEEILKEAKAILKALREGKYEILEES